MHHHFSMKLNISIQSVVAILAIWFKVIEGTPASGSGPIDELNRPLHRKFL
jgi:hypothetical protein